MCRLPGLPPPPPPPDEAVVAWMTVDSPALVEAVTVWLYVVPAAGR